MITVYVLDVPEFRAMVETSRSNDDIRVSGPHRGYWTLEASDEMRFDRRAMKMKPAVWYGIFTGGLIGEIARWGRDEVRVVGTNRPL